MLQGYGTWCSGFADGRASRYALRHVIYWWSHYYPKLSLVEQHVEPHNLRATRSVYVQWRI